MNRARYATGQAAYVAQHGPSSEDQPQDGTNAEMAAKFNVSQRTIELRRAKVMRKLKVGSLAELIRLAVAAENGHWPEASSRTLAKPFVNGNGNGELLPEPTGASGAPSWLGSGIGLS